MVIGEKYVWAHLGKTGGNSVHRMFEIVKKQVIYIDDIHKPEKHFSFTRNEKRLGYDLTDSRKRILTIRRLPSWALSMVFHKKTYQGIPICKLSLLNGYVRMAKNPEQTPDSGNIDFREVKIDRILENQMCGRVDYWLRTENLADDFIRIMNQFFPISWVEKFRIRRVRRNVNKNYHENALSYFTPSEMEQLYANCPLWSEIERKVYGNLLNECEL